MFTHRESVVLAREGSGARPRTPACSLVVALACGVCLAWAASPIAARVAAQPGAPSTEHPLPTEPEHAALADETSRPGAPDLPVSTFRLAHDFQWSPGVALVFVPAMSFSVRAADAFAFDLRLAGVGLIGSPTGTGSNGTWIRPANPELGFYWVTDDLPVDVRAFRLRVGGVVGAPLTRAFTDGPVDTTVYGWGRRSWLRQREWQFFDDVLSVGVDADGVLTIEYLRILAEIAVVVGIPVRERGSNDPGVFLLFSAGAEYVIDDTSLGGGFVVAYTSLLPGENAQFSPYVVAQFGQHEVFFRMRAGVSVVPDTIGTSSFGTVYRTVSWTFGLELGVPL